MYVVLGEDFTPETHTVWGPFQTEQEARQWAESEPDEVGEGFSIQPIIKPINPDAET